MSIKNISIPNNPLSNLEARLWLPKNPIASVVITHSWRNNMDEAVCADAAKEFYNSNYAVLQLNLPGHSKGALLRDVSFNNASNAVDNAVSYLLNYAGANPIFGFGISLGSAAIAYSSKHNFDAQALLSYSPLINPSSIYENYKDGIEANADFLEKNGFVNLVSNSGRGEFEMGAQWIDEAKNHSAKYLALFKKSKIPTFLIQGTADSRYNYEKYNSFANDHGAKSLFIEGADHNFTEHAHRIILIGMVKDYFKSFIN